jgi:hypothetical protein
MGVKVAEVGVDAANRWMMTIPIPRPERRNRR